jgi:hypothetical protein
MSSRPRISGCDCLICRFSFILPLLVDCISQAKGKNTWGKNNIDTPLFQAAVTFDK